MDLIFATHNKGKLKEVQGLVPPAIRVISLEQLGMSSDIAETGDTLEANALLKARFVHALYKKPVIADDTGLEVDSLGGAPGVYSARYAGPHGDADKNMDLLLQNLSGQQQRKARFRTVIAYIDDQLQEHLFEGIVEGEILNERSGGKGFGYDPVFKPHGSTQSFAEMSLEQKNAMSHRARALASFIKFIQK